MKGELALLLKALAFAAHKHRDQRRKDPEASPYINHPIALAGAFGARIARIVAEVTDDKTLPKAERKRLQVAHAGALSQEAKLVKLADKICNLRDVAERPPASWSLERRREYFDWAKQVVDRLRGAQARLEAAVD